ncbi:MAG: hypothetical protein KTR31_36045 [Myxococcales bacterium]|nr:hypothetical protein [Myxococcales bacterium]
MIAAALMMASSAHAAPTVHIEGHSTVLTLGDNAPQIGGGVGVRVGMPLNLVAIKLVPEIGITGWQDLTKPVGDGLLPPALLVPEAGARFSFGKVVEPGVFVHALLPLDGGGNDLGWDAGASIDVTAIPKVDFGLQAGVVSFGQAPALTAGGHLGIKF